MSSELERVRLIAFPGAPNLPVFVAQEQGYFERRGVEVELTTTPNSAWQAERLARGDFDIAGTAFDNVVAYREGQGAVSFDSPPQFHAFMGATQIALSLVVSPDVDTYADLRGKSLALDALATGFAFVLYEMLARGGLEPRDYTFAAVGATPQRWESVKDGTHAGTITIEPFTSIARASGFRELDVSSNVLSAYQGGVFAADRAWLDEHADAARAFMHGYLDGLAWVTDGNNRDAAADVLVRNMPAIRPQVVDAVLDSLLSPRSGLTPDGAILTDGVATVLELRSRYGPGDAAFVDGSRYLALDLYGTVMTERRTRTS